MFESLPQDHSAVLAGSCIVLSIGKGQAVDLKAEAEEAKRLLQLALSIDENDADTLALGGHITAWSGDFDTAIEMVDRSIALIQILMLLDAARLDLPICGPGRGGSPEFERSTPLSPLDPLLYLTLTGMALAFIRLQRFDEAVVVAMKAHRKNDETETDILHAN